MNNKDNTQISEILKQFKGATAVYDSEHLNIAFVNKAMLEILGTAERIIV